MFKSIVAISAVLGLAAPTLAHAAASGDLAGSRPGVSAVHKKKGEKKEEKKEDTEKKEEHPEDAKPPQG